MTLMSEREAGLYYRMNENVERELGRLPDSTYQFRARTEVDAFIARIRKLNAPLKKLLAE